MLENILNLIYPSVCGFCGKISQNSLCSKCETKIKKYQINLIKKKNNVHIDKIFCIYKYEDIIRDTILEYKFKNKAYLYETFSKIILKDKKICGFFKKYDIIIPVPISRKRKIKRGYNQTYLISKEIAKNLNLKCENRCLIKYKDTIEQSKLNKAERKTNLKDAYIVVNRKRIKDKNVILLDDIYTTGSTVNECAKVLKAAGANKIGVLAIAKD